MPTFASRARRTSAVVTALALGFTGALVAAPAANAATFTVTSLADFGPGTLRQAVLDANANAGADVINFSISGTVALAAVITITEGVAINNPTVGAVTITRSADAELLSVDMATADQDFSIDNILFDGAGAVSTARGINVVNSTFAPRDVTITDSDFGAFEAAVVGGAVRIAEATGDLRIDNTDVHDNISGAAVPAIFAQGIAGSTLVSNSSFSDNDGESGGGLNILFSGDVTLSNLTFTDNTTWNAGGALAVYQVASLLITDSEFTGNSATSQVGGAVYISAVAGPVSIQGSSFTNSSSTSSGGALFIDQVLGLEILDSTFTNNVASQRGGAVYVNDAGDTAIARNTFYLNDSNTLGGAIDFENVSGYLQVNDNVFDQNTANTRGGAISILTADEDVLFDSNTFTDNSTGGTGGALSVDTVVQSTFFVFGNTFANNLSPILNTVGGTSVSFTLVDEATIVLGNSTFYEPSPLTNPVVYAGTVLATSELWLASSTLVGHNGVLTVGSNLGFVIASNSIINGDLNEFGTIDAFDIGDNAAGIEYSIVTTAFEPANMIAGVGNQFSTNPQLGALANNGGPTQTMLPAAASPAVNAGDPAYSFFPFLPTDQRGGAFTRIANGRVDIGAVELQTLALAATGLEVSPLLPIGAGGILLLGAAALLFARRRRAA